MADKLTGLGYDYDYSLAGKQAANGHYTDKGKLPWHPTFSQESAYSSPKFIGGVWKGNDYMPSMDMLQSGNTKGLGRYMREVEPGSKLLVTPPMSKKEFKRLTEENK